MFPYRRRRWRLVTLLALWAATLAAFAPPVSQLLLAARLAAALPADAGHAHPAAPGHTAAAHEAHAGHDGDPLHACDYCELFAHSPVVPAIAHVAAMVPRQQPAAPTSPVLPAPRRPGSPVGIPRGPPAPFRS